MAGRVEAEAAVLLEKYRKGEIGTAELMVRGGRGNLVCACCINPSALTSLP
jgi:hypothetical protein